MPEFFENAFFLSSGLVDDFANIYDFISPLVSIADGVSTLLGMFV